MKRILQTWLIPILLVLMLVGAACAFVPFDRRQETKAKEELASLVDNAFLRMASMEDTGEPAKKAALDGLILQARAVARILAHDDALLESDALAAMAAQLGLDQIDICGLEGTLSASSDPTRVGLAVVGDPAYAWTQSVTNDPLAAASQADAETAGLLYACVAREDADGFALVTRTDAYIASLSEKADAERVTSDMAYGGDLLFQATVDGEDGYFTDQNCLCLRKTQDGVSLIAARPLTEVHAVRRAVLLVLAGCAVAALICGLAYYILHLEPADEADEPEANDEYDDAPARLPAFLTEAAEEPAAEETAPTQAPVAHARADRRRKRTAGAPEAAQQPTPRRPRRTKKRADEVEETGSNETEPRETEAQDDESHGDDGFDKIFD